MKAKIIVVISLIIMVVFAALEYLIPSGIAAFCAGFFLDEALI